MDVILARLAATFDPATIETITGQSSLIGGFLIGILWGYVLQKGGLGSYNSTSGMFRMQDFTFWRVGTPMLMTAMVLLYLFNDLGIIELHPPRTIVIAQVLGGLIMGAGIAILGYCPALACTALGEGAIDAIPGMIGMVIGSVIYAEFVYGTKFESRLEFIDLGKITIPDMFLVFNHWFYIIAFVIMCNLFLIGITMYDTILKHSFRSFNKISSMLEGKKVKDS
ncbi:MAG: YeeE/YedE family protein [Nitrospirae bacterium]|nr:YeeE/YedE family protein [Nitrospirota bacterium]MBF0542643.1 YeeE/YedE family protein [Nitrospirota bacterium]